MESIPSRAVACVTLAGLILTGALPARAEPVAHPPTTLSSKGAQDPSPELHDRLASAAGRRNVGLTVLLVGVSLAPLAAGFGIGGALGGFNACNSSEYFSGCDTHIGVGGVFGYGGIGLGVVSGAMILVGIPLLVSGQGAMNEARHKGAVSLSPMLDSGAGPRNGSYALTVSF
jgi:hypothetical protein